MWSKGNVYFSTHSCTQTSILSGSTYSVQKHNSNFCVKGEPVETCTFVNKLLHTEKYHCPWERGKKREHARPLVVGLLIHKEGGCLSRHETTWELYSTFRNSTGRKQYPCFQVMIHPTLQTHTLFRSHIEQDAILEKGTFWWTNGHRLSRPAYPTAKCPYRLQANRGRYHSFLSAPHAFLPSKGQIQWLPLTQGKGESLLLLRPSLWSGSLRIYWNIS